MDVFRGFSFTLIGVTTARFAILLFILMGMSDGVERGKECEAVRRAAAGLARKLCWGYLKLFHNKIYKTRIPY